MSAGNILWWILYLVAGIWLQKLVPGIDALVPALIICLQERNRQQTVLFLIICIVVQEGTGTLPVGASVIWYSTVIACYYIGGWVFMSGNLMFIIVLSLSMGVSRGFIFWGMSLLQPLPLDINPLISANLLQILCTPVIWALALWSRRKMV